jgi:transcription initiation factor IIE alpha subunit
MTLDQVVKKWEKWFKRDEIIAFQTIAQYWRLSVHELLDQLVKVDKIELNDSCYIPITNYVGWFLAACEHDPEKSICPTCGKLNLLFDDCGYFYSETEEAIIKFNYWNEVLSSGLKFIPRCRECKVPHTAER